MLNEENIEKLEKVLNLQDLDEESKSVYDTMKKEALKAVNIRKKYIEKRRRSVYQTKLNNINTKIYYARIAQDKEKLEILQQEHDMLIKKHKLGMI